MSKRAEEMALKAYPIHGEWIGNQYGEWNSDINSQKRKAYQEGYEQAEKELVSLINQLCEAILFDWKDAADLAWKTLTQIKVWEE